MNPQWYFFPDDVIRSLHQAFPDEAIPSATEGQGGGTCSLRELKTRVFLATGIRLTSQDLPVRIGEEPLLVLARGNWYGFKPNHPWPAGSDEELLREATLAFQVEFPASGDRTRPHAPEALVWRIFTGFLVLALGFLSISSLDLIQCQTWLPEDDRSLGWFFLSFVALTLLLVHKARPSKMFDLKQISWLSDPGHLYLALTDLILFLAGAEFSQLLGRPVHLLVVALFLILSLLFLLRLQRNTHDYSSRHAWWTGQMQYLDSLWKQDGMPGELQEWMNDWKSREALSLKGGRDRSATSAFLAFGLSLLWILTCGSLLLIQSRYCFLFRFSGSLFLLLCAGAATWMLFRSLRKLPALQGPDAEAGKVPGVRTCLEHQATLSAFRVVPDFPFRITQEFKPLEVSVHPGEKVLFYGKDGSGIREILEVLAGIKSPRYGSVHLNDVSFRELAFCISSNLGPCNGTFRESILYQVVGESRVIDEYRLQQLDEILGFSANLKRYHYSFLHEMPEQEQELPQEIRHQIRLMEALYQKRPIYVLDQPFRFLDAFEIMLTLERLMQFLSGATVLVSEFREIPFFRFDKVYVIQEGAIIDEL